MVIVEIPSWLLVHMILKNNSSTTPLKYRSNFQKVNIRLRKSLRRSHCMLLTERERARERIEAYLKPSLTSKMELICEKVVNCFRKKSPM